MAVIDGIWDTVTKSPMGDQKGVFELETEQDRLRGSSESPFGKVDFTDGVVEGDEIRWVIEMTRPIKMTLEGKALVSGNAMTGTMKMGTFGEFALTGTRRA